eukprot:3730490-Amphidinium_carterae.1
MVKCSYNLSALVTMDQFSKKIQLRVPARILKLRSLSLSKGHANEAFNGFADFCAFGGETSNPGLEEVEDYRVRQLQSSNLLIMCVD